MSKIDWDKPGTRLYEAGVGRGILFLMKSDGTYYNGVAWNGLTAVDESVTGGESTPIYADNFVYGRVVSEENYTATIKAYNFPQEFLKCLGKLEAAAGVTLGQQRRRRFGFCYTTLVGNDIDDKDYHYRLHLVYNCFTGDPDTEVNTIGETPEPTLFSWEIQSDKVLVDGYKPTATIVLDKYQLEKAGMLDVFTTIENMVLGTATTESILPTPQMIIDLQKVGYIQDSFGENIMDSFGNFIEAYVIV